MLENFQGDSWGPIPPLCMSSWPLPWVEVLPAVPHNFRSLRNQSSVLSEVMSCMPLDDCVWEVLLWGAQFPCKLNVHSYFARILKKVCLYLIPGGKGLLLLIFWAENDQIYLFELKSAQVEFLIRMTKEAKVPWSPGMVVPHTEPQPRSEGGWIRPAERGNPGQVSRKWGWLPSHLASHNDLLWLELSWHFGDPQLPWKGAGGFCLPTASVSSCLCSVCGLSAILRLSCHFGLVSQITVINANSQHELWAAQMLDNPRAGREPSFCIS